MGRSTSAQRGRSPGYAPCVATRTTASAPSATPASVRLRGLGELTAMAAANDHSNSHAASCCEELALWRWPDEAGGVMVPASCALAQAQSLRLHQPVQGVASY